MRVSDRFYEFFKATHYIAAIVFVVFFFIHCDFRLSSWFVYVRHLVKLLLTVFYQGLFHRDRSSLRPVLPLPANPNLL